MPEHNYKFDVKMHCSGCSGAVEKVLKATEGMCTHPFINNNSIMVTSILISPLTREKKASHTTSPLKSKRSKSAPTRFRTRLCSRRSKRLGNRSRLGRRMVNLLISNHSHSHFQLSIFSDSSGTRSPLLASSHWRYWTVGGGRRRRIGL